MARAFIGYTLKNGNIKTVAVKYDGELELLGEELNEYFKDKTDVQDIVKSSIKSICDGEVEYRDDLEYLTEDDYEYYEYDGKADLVDDFESDTYYYLFENDGWYVVKPNTHDFNELEIVLEEEEY